MVKQRGTTHTTLTETAAQVVKVLQKQPAIKMIAPGEITTTNRRGTNQRFITVVYTHAGFELIITGQSVQKIAVHTDSSQQSRRLVHALQQHKKLQNFSFKSRERKPGI